MAEAQLKSYAPVVVIGPRSGWKNVLTLYWSHDAPKSGEAFQLVRQLEPEISRKSLAVILFQISGDGDGSLKTASQFLCAPQDRYGVLASAFLDALALRGSSFSDGEFSDFLRRAIERFKLPKSFSDCLRGGDDHERVSAIQAFRDMAARKDVKAASLYLNGTLVAPRIGEIRKLLLNQ